MQVVHCSMPAWHFSSSRHRSMPCCSMLYCCHMRPLQTCAANISESALGMAGNTGISSSFPVDLTEEAPFSAGHLSSCPSTIQAPAMQCPAKLWCPVWDT